MQYQITTFAAAGLTPSGTIQRELSRQTCRHLSPERAFDVNPNFHRNLSMPRLARYNKKFTNPNRREVAT